MKSGTKLPYPLLVAILIVVFVAMRCVGEYAQDRERDAHIESVLESRTAMGLNKIPDCGRRGQSVMFSMGKDGLLVYWCGR